MKVKKSVVFLLAMLLCFAAVSCGEKEVVVIEPSSQTTSESSATEDEPSADVSAETSMPTIEESSAPVSEESKEPSSEPVSEPESELVSEPLSEPESEPVSEPVSESVSEPDENVSSALPEEPDIQLPYDPTLPPQDGAEVNSTVKRSSEIDVGDVRGGKEVVEYYENGWERHWHYNGDGTTNFVEIFEFNDAFLRSVSYDSELKVTGYSVAYFSGSGRACRIDEYDADGTLCRTTICNAVGEIEETIEY